MQESLVDSIVSDAPVRLVELDACQLECEVRAGRAHSSRETPMSDQAQCIELTSEFVTKLPKWEST